MKNCIEDLPLELVKSILTLIPNLYQVALVNRFFYMAAMPSIWNAPEHMGSNRRVKTLKARDIRKYLLLAGNHPLGPIPLGYFIRKLRLEREGSVKEFVLLLTHTPLVEHLELKNSQICDDEVIEIIKLCPRLGMLCLYSNNVTDRSMEALGQHCSYLYGITLISNPHLTWKTFVSLKNCGLKRLNITACSGLITTEATTHLVRFNQLTSLILCHCRVTGECIRQISSTPLSKLKEFLICGSVGQESWMNDNLLVPFIKSHPQLEVLNLSSSCKLTDISLMAIAKHLSSLRQLELHHTHLLSYQGLRNVIRACSQLEYIRIPAYSLTMCSFPEPPELFWDLKSGQTISQLARDHIEQIRLGIVLDHSSKDGYLCDCEQKDNHNDYYY